MIVVKVAISLDVLVRLLDAGSDRDVAAELRLDPLGELVGCRALRGCRPASSRAALLVQQLLRRRHVEDREGGTADRAQVAVLGDADDLELLSRPERRHTDPVADLQVLVVGDALVDGNLAAAAGPAALDEVERVEAVVLGRCLDPERERRRAARVDRLTVRSQQLRLEVLNRAGGDLDAVDRPRTRSSSVSSGIGGLWADSPSKLKPASLPVTTASVPAYESTKIASNALSIVSVRT